MTDQEVDRAVQEVRESFISKMAVAFWGETVDSMESAGFGVYGEDCSHERALLLVAVEALLAKSKGMDHPVQGVAETIIDIDESGDSFVLNMDFNDSEENAT